MATVDLVIIIALIFFVYWGLRKGFNAEMLGFTGWIIALLIGLALADKASSLLDNKVPSIQKVSWVLSFFALIIAVRIVLLLFFQKKTKSGTTRPPSNLDRFSGAVLGFLQGAFVISVLLIAIAILPIKGNLKKFENHSLLYPHLKNFSVYIVEAIGKHVPLTKRGVDSIMRKFENEKQMIPLSKEELDKLAADKVEDAKKNVSEKLTKEELKKIQLNDKSQREKAERGPRR